MEEDQVDYRIVLLEVGVICSYLTVRRMADCHLPYYTLK
jgi:hypothetical protein